KLFLGRALVLVVITLAVGGMLNAQDSNPGNPTILRSIQELQGSVNGLASQLTNLTNQVNGLTGQGTTLTSLLNNITTNLTSLTNQVNTIGGQVASLTTAPTVIATGFEFKPAGFSGGCSAQNVGNSTVTVKMELITVDGVVLQNPPNFIIPA